MRIAGTNIPENKRVVIALTYIFGIGKTKSEEILAETKVSPDKRVKDLTEDEQNAIRELAEKNRIEEDLRREISSNIKRLKDIKAYRGSRHARRLPTREQRPTPEL